MRSGWKVEPLAAISERVTVGIASAATHAYRSAGVPMLRNQNIKSGRLDDSDVLFLDPAYEVTFRNKRLRTGDLITARTGYPGATCVVPAKYCGGQSFTTLVIRPNPQAVTSAYLCYFINSFQGQAFIDQSQIGGAQKNINAGSLRQMPILIPELAEQRAITDSLTDADDLINTTERLIAKKQAIKQGMLQQVFAVPEGDNQRAGLGTLVSMLSGGTPNRSNDGYWSGTIPWISATTLKALEVATSDQAVTAKAVRVGSKMAPLHSTLVLVRGSALHSEIRASLVTAPVCFNQDVKALVPTARLEPKFLTYSIHANASRLLSLVTSAGNTAGVLDTNVLKDFEIWLPSCERQRTVVSIFDDVTSEIDALSVRLAKARAIKAGMMQQLMTGRTRLPVEATS